MVGTEEDDLIVFCAQLALARVAKDETLPEIIQRLVNVIIQPPEQLDIYQELPCGQGASWNAAALALGNLRPERLQMFSPLLQEELVRAEEWRATALAEMLLFLWFSRENQEKQWSQSELTVQQRSILSLFYDRSDFWEDDDDILYPLPKLLKGYGLPGNQKALANFLNREPPPPVQQTHQYTDTTPHYMYRRYDALRDHLSEVFREQLSKSYPEIRGYRIGGLLVGGVMADDLLEVNEELVFRIPDNPAAIWEMEREYALLRFLQERVPLPVPNPLYVNLEADEPGRIFIGYRKLPGKPLYKERLESVDSEETVEALALQIDSFLYMLHHISREDLAGIALPVVHGRKNYEALYDRVRKDLFPHLPPEMCEPIAASFQTFLDTPQNFALTPVLIHGNFGPRRILYHAKTRSISGIISFTHTGLGDPASDLAALLGSRGYGKDFVQRFERVYPDLSMLWERIQFYVNASILQETFSRLEQQNVKNIAHEVTLHPL
jgi:aminoglycoside 2''-phosphotransferase